MSWLSSLISPKQPEIKTTTYTDSVKSNVANPLSSYLSQEIGKGLPQYTGEVTPNVAGDANLTNRYNEFLSSNANDWFDKYVDQPQTKSFRENLLPTITEGFAGNLRGSGRFGTEEDSINKFEQGLADTRYAANKELPGLQLDAATKYYGLLQKQDQDQYNAWSATLPENNPVLKTAIEFLQKSTESGIYQDKLTTPGQEGGGLDLFGSLFSTGGAGSSIMKMLLNPASWTGAGASLAGAGASIAGAAGSIGAALAFL